MFFIWNQKVLSSLHPCPPSLLLECFNFFLKKKENVILPSPRCPLLILNSLWIKRKEWSWVLFWLFQNLWLEVGLAWAELFLVGNFCVLVTVVRSFLFFSVLSQRYTFIWGHFPLLPVLCDVFIGVSLLTSVLWLRMELGLELLGCSHRSPWVSLWASCLPVSAPAALRDPSHSHLF